MQWAYAITTGLGFSSRDEMLTGECGAMEHHHRSDLLWTPATSWCDFNRCPLMFQISTSKSVLVFFFTTFHPAASHPCFVLTRGSQ